MDTNQNSKNNSQDSGDLSEIPNYIDWLKKKKINLVFAIIIVAIFATLAAFLIIFTAKKVSIETTEMIASRGEKGESAVKQGKKFAPGELLLKFKDPVPPQEQDELIKKWGFSVKEEIKQVKIKVVNVPEEAEEVLADALSHHPKVDFAEVNTLLPPTFIPNDPDYSRQWHLPKIENPSAWDKTAGENVVIAIADSGVDPTHPDLVDNLVPGKALTGGGEGTSDVYGHGTEVAGAAGAVGNNANQIASVAYKSKIMPLRITDSSGWAYVSTIVNAIVYAADHGAKVINLSFGFLCEEDSISKAASYMKQKGGIVVVSAGNQGTDSGCVEDSNIIFVSATDTNDKLATFSTYGKNVDVAAPGLNVLTTKNGGTTGYVAGTSFSSPITVGVLALIWSIAPTLTPDQVQRILFDSAVDLGDPGYDIYYGWGRVDAGRAVFMASGGVPPPTDNIAPVVSITFPSGGSTVSGGIEVKVDASDNVGIAKVELLKNNVLVAIDDTLPYSFFWDTTKDPNGTTTLQARAYDTSGNIGLSSKITVLVNNVVADVAPPVVTITQPADGSAIPSKGILTINVNATDNESGMQEIDIFFDDVLRKSSFNTTNCTYNLNPKKVSKGAHTIRALAVDKAGNTASSSITVYK